MKGICFKVPRDRIKTSICIQYGNFLCFNVMKSVSSSMFRIWQQRPQHPKIMNDAVNDWYFNSLADFMCEIYKCSKDAINLCSYTRIELERKYKILSHFKCLNLSMSLSLSHFLFFFLLLLFLPGLYNISNWSCYKMSERKTENRVSVSHCNSIWRSCT